MYCILRQFWEEGMEKKEYLSWFMETIWKCFQNSFLPLYFWLMQVPCLLSENRLKKSRWDRADTFSPPSSPWPLGGSRGCTQYSDLEQGHPDLSWETAVILKDMLLYFGSTKGRPFCSFKILHASKPR